MDTRLILVSAQSSIIQVRNYVAYVLCFYWLALICVLYDGQQRPFRMFQPQVNDRRGPFQRALACQMEETIWLLTTVGIEMVEVSETDELGSTTKPREDHLRVPCLAQNKVECFQKRSMAIIEPLLVGNQTVDARLWKQFRHDMLEE